MSPVYLLTKKYKDRLNNLILMDDYDGGQASVLREVVSDLEMLDAMNPADFLALQRFGDD